MEKFEVEYTAFVERVSDEMFAALTDAVATGQNFDPIAKQYKGEKGKVFTFQIETYRGVRSCDVIYCDWTMYESRQVSVWFSKRDGWMTTGYGMDIPEWKKEACITIAKRLLNGT